jgi:uridine kinase
MPLGDILVITDNHRKAGREITDLVLQSYTGEKMSVAIGAESGAGKSEISHVIAENLFKSEKQLKSFIVHTDDFFVLPHKERNELRRKSNLDSVGPSEIDFDELHRVLQSFESGGQILIPILEFITSSGVGPSEIDFDELNRVLQSFESGGQILIPILEFITSSAYRLLVDFKDVQILICEGLYAPFLDVTHRIFIDLTYHDTRDFRAQRGKEVADEFRLKVLEKEHQAVRALRKRVDYLITEDYSLTKL